MADEVTSESKMEDLDIENMKVSQLKKKLKDIGLPVTGNKSELVERLQGSLLATKKLESSGSELEISLLNDSKLNSSSTDAEGKTDEKLCDDERPAPSPEKSKEVPVSSSALIPLKKRVIAETASGNDKKPIQKKIVLNRNHIPTPKFVLNEPPESLKIKSILMDDKSDVDKEKKSSEVITCVSTVKEGPSKIVLSGVKSISEDERISLRAKRFNITAPEPSSKTGKISITSKKDTASKITSSSSSILTPCTTGPTFDVLQKRALRFGVNVSKVMRQWEDQQNVQKRKSKFNVGNGVSSAEEQEKKKKRAERFGLP